MGSLSDEARWFLADLVLEHRIEGESLNVVHVNTHLVAAGSPEEAYEKSSALGRDAEQEYVNTDGRQVQVVFRGLKELDVIHEPLEDGSEIMYSEAVGVPEDRLRDWVKPRDSLGVFSPVAAKKSVPNYLPLEFEPLVREHGQGGSGGA